MRVYCLLALAVIVGCDGFKPTTLEWDTAGSSPKDCGCTITEVGYCGDPELAELCNAVRDGDCDAIPRLTYVDGNWFGDCDDADAGVTSLCMSEDGNTTAIDEQAFESAYGSTFCPVIKQCREDYGIVAKEDEVCG